MTLIYEWKTLVGNKPSVRRTRQLPWIKSMHFHDAEIAIVVGCKLKATQ